VAAERDVEKLPTTKTMTQRETYPGSRVRQPSGRNCAKPPLDAKKNRDGEVNEKNGRQKGKKRKSPAMAIISTPSVSDVVRTPILPKKNSKKSD